MEGILKIVGGKIGTKTVELKCVNIHLPPGPCQKESLAIDWSDWFCECNLNVLCGDIDIFACLLFDRVWELSHPRKKV